MEEENKNNAIEPQEEEQGTEEDLLTWVVPEFDTPPKTKKWYIVAGFLALLVLIYAIYTSNFLFALIIIIAGVILVLSEGQKAQKVTVSLTEEGLILGRKFYDYDEFKNFAIVYKPKQGTKNLYFEFQNFFRHRITIPLEDMNPLTVQEILSDYLEEDTDRTDPPLSEQISQLLKL